VVIAQRIAGRDVAHPRGSRWLWIQDTLFGSTMLQIFQLLSVIKFPSAHSHRGHQFAVCARCTGLYAGFTVTTLIYRLFLLKADRRRREQMVFIPRAAGN